ncbi:glycosyltransferase family 4 protein [Streptomyces sp. NPDC054933]
MQSNAGAVVVALHDGVFGCGTGAGHSNRRVLELLDELMPPSVDLVVLPVQLAADSVHYDEEWHAQVRDRLARSERSVRVCPVDNGTQGRARFGGLKAFGSLAEATVAQVSALRTEYSRGLVLLLDVPFAGAAAQLPLRPGWSTVILPRSSAALHCPQHHRRVAWERTSLRHAAAGGVLVGAISQHMRAHLVEDLGVAEAAVIDLVNGLSEADRSFSPGGGGELLPAEAVDGFFFAMGRAVPRKGFEDLLQALVVLQARGQEVPHLVLAAVSEQDEPTPYQQELAACIEEHQMPVTLIRRFSPAVRGLLAHPALRAVVVPSRVEPFGRIPLEAYAVGAAPVVATAAGGLAELVVDEATGFAAVPGDPVSLADALTRAAGVDEHERDRMRAAGRELLRAYDYRENLAAFLRRVAPWALAEPPSPVAPGAGLSVLQVPEVNGWNPYVGAAEAALRDHGLTVLRLELCRDAPIPSPPADLEALEAMRPPDVIHLHWPEKLARQYGAEAALRLLTRWKQGGARIVQTVHNLVAHEPSPALAWFARRVDALTDGVHVFSADHERALRQVRPGLPSAVLHLPHPLFPPASDQLRLARPQPMTLGCFGRLRGYKRTVSFAQAFLNGAVPNARLLVAGAPDSTETDAALAALAAGDQRLEYRPGFVEDHAGFWRLLAEVDSVALPYEQLHSSGVLVAALQAGRRILSPTPLGGTGLYTHYAHHWWWTTVDPWDDAAAVTAWQSAAMLSSALPPNALALPTWQQAAEQLAAFYARLRPLSAPTGRAPARVGIVS